jgi:tetratricopeptide (TPR) repeat protein
MQELKEKGNEAFKRGEHEEAYRLYTQAIELATLDAAESVSTNKEENAGNNAQDSGLHLLFSNRAATLLALERYEEALQDCDKVLEIDPKFMKGYLRKSMALKALGRKREALEVAKVGLKLDSNPKSVGVPELTKLAHTIQGEMKPKATATKRSAKETEELVKDYNDVVAEVERLNFELETREREIRSLTLTLNYLEQVKEKNGGQLPNTYLPMSRMFIKKHPEEAVQQLGDRIKEAKTEFDAMREKMGHNEIRLKGLSSELEEIMRSS